MSCPSAFLETICRLSLRPCARRRSLLVCHIHSSSLWTRNRWTPFPTRRQSWLFQTILPQLTQTQLEIRQTRMPPPFQVMRFPQNRRQNQQLHLVQHQNMIILVFPLQQIMSTFENIRIRTVRSSANFTAAALPEFKKPLATGFKSHPARWRDTLNPNIWQSVSALKNS